MKSLFKPAGLMALLLSSAYVCHSQNNQASGPGNSGSFLQTAVTTQYNKEKGGSESEALDAILPESNPVLKARFSNLFPSAVQQQWYRLNDGYYVSFFSNGRKSSAVFSGKGRISYAILDCRMEQLPEAFSDEIRKDYPGYQFMSGFEITARHTVTYQAILENAKQYVILRSDGEVIEKIQQLNKSN